MNPRILECRHQERQFTFFFRSVSQRIQRLVLDFSCCLAC